MSQSATGLQKSLDNLAEYCKKWQLKINVNKTRSMVFNSRQGRFKFFVGNEPIEEASQMKYLGIVFTPSGSFNACLKYLYNKAHKSMYLFRKHLQAVPAMSIKSYLKVFDSIIKPTLLYGCEVWGAYMYDGNRDNIFTILADCKSLLEKLHSKYCKSILSVHKRCSNVGIRAELGRYPLMVNVIGKIFNYYLSILNRENESFVKTAITIQTALSTSSTKKGWLSFICKISEQSNWFTKISDKNHSVVAN